MKKQKTSGHKRRIFIAHSSNDKEFTRRLAFDLKDSGFHVWFDEWEIAVGDSIVEKIFVGLKATDTLIAVLSRASVKSKWVKEELDTYIIRRIQNGDCSIMPVLVETCRIPTPLIHIRYADFRGNYHSGFNLLLESLAPERQLWNTLDYLYNQFEAFANQLLKSRSYRGYRETATNILPEINGLLNRALDIRTQIESRQTTRKTDGMSFFDKIEFLVSRGIDIRSQTWNELVRMRSFQTHGPDDSRRYFFSAEEFVTLLRPRYPNENDRKVLIFATKSLVQVMRILCFKKPYIEFTLFPNF